MKIHISQATKTLVQAKNYKIVERGTISVKGKGEMKTYFVEGKTDSNGNLLRMPYENVYEEYQRSSGVTLIEDAGKNNEKEIFVITNENL